MAGYGTAIAYAKTLERHDIAELLLETLREEKRADMGLSDLAQNQVNPDAKWSAIVNKVSTPARTEIK
jgi:ferritin-like metal-binding protein YciE